MEKGKSFKKWCWISMTSTCTKVNPDTDTKSFTKINSSWIRPKCKINYKIPRKQHKRKSQ